MLPPVVTVFGAAAGAADLVGAGGLAGRHAYLWRRWPAPRCPPSGSCVRARWCARAATARPTLQTAFALEAVADEVVFMLGPILVTVLATAVHPVAGLGTALVAGVVGTLVFAAQRATEPPPAPATGPARAAAPRALADARCRSPWCALALGLPVRRRRGERPWRSPRSRAAEAYAGAAARALGARQPAGRRRHRRHPWRRGPACGCGWARSAMVVAMVAAAVHRLDPGDGARAAARRLRDRADPDRDHVPGRAGGAAGAADRGDGDHAHRRSWPGSRPAPPSPASSSTAPAPSAAYLVSVGAGGGLPPWSPRRCPVRPRTATPPSRRRSPVEWRNWSGLASAQPPRGVRPAVDASDVVAAVAAPARPGTTVKMVGTGHSFTGDRRRPSTRCCCPAR